MPWLQAPSSLRAKPSMTPGPRSSSPWPVSSPLAMPVTHTAPFGPSFATASPQIASQPAPHAQASSQDPAALSSPYLPSQHLRPHLLPPNTRTSGPGLSLRSSRPSSRWPTVLLTLWTGPGLGAGDGRPLGAERDLEGREAPGGVPPALSHLPPHADPQCTAPRATTTTPARTAASAAPWAPTSPSSARITASAARATPARTSTAPPTSHTAKVGAALPAAGAGNTGAGRWGRSEPSPTRGQQDPWDPALL